MKLEHQPRQKWAVATLLPPSRPLFNVVSLRPTFEGGFGSAEAEGVAAGPVPEAGASATAEVGGGYFASSFEATFEGGFGSRELRLGQCLKLEHQPRQKWAVATLLPPSRPLFNVVSLRPLLRVALVRLRQRELRLGQCLKLEHQPRQKWAVATLLPPSRPLLRVALVRVEAEGVAAGPVPEAGASATAEGGFGSAEAEELRLGQCLKLEHQPRQSGRPLLRVALGSVEAEGVAAGPVPEAGASAMAEVGGGYFASSFEALFNVGGLVRLRQRELRLGQCLKLEHQPRQKWGGRGSLRLGQCLKLEHQPRQKWAVATLLPPSRPLLRVALVRSRQRELRLGQLPEAGASATAEVGGGYFASSFEAYFLNVVSLRPLLRVALVRLRQRELRLGQCLKLEHQPRQKWAGGFGSAEAEGVAAGPVPEAGASATAKVGGGYFASSFEATFEGGFGSVEAEGVAAGQCLKLEHQPRQKPLFTWFLFGHFEVALVRLRQRELRLGQCLKLEHQPRQKWAVATLLPPSRPLFNVVFSSATFEGGFGSAEAGSCGWATGASATAEVGGGYFASSFEATFEGGFGSVEAEGVAAGPVLKLEHHHGKSGRWLLASSFEATLRVALVRSRQRELRLGQCLKLEHQPRQKWAVATLLPPSRPLFNVVSLRPLLRVALVRLRQRELRLGQCLKLEHQPRQKWAVATLLPPSRPLLRVVLVRSRQRELRLGQCMKLEHQPRQKWAVAALLPPVPLAAERVLCPPTLEPLTLESTEESPALEPILEPIEKPSLVLKAEVGGGCFASSLEATFEGSFSSATFESTFGSAEAEGGAAGPVSEAGTSATAEIGGGCFASSLKATFEGGFGSAEAEGVAAAPVPEAGASATAEGWLVFGATAAHCADLAWEWRTELEEPSLDLEAEVGSGCFASSLEATFEGSFSSATFESTFGSAEAEGVAAAPVSEAGASATKEVGGGCFASSLEAVFEGGFSSATFEGTSGSAEAEGVAAVPVPEAGASATAEGGRSEGTAEATASAPSPPPPPPLNFSLVCVRAPP
ncbi:hypothetical protein TYRP_006253 [Tyrophagus putrescentiae]|nr:hypothetical protein TYRP_006253 [Tyrophagus putrescentiae]